MDNKNHTLGETHRLRHLRASLGFALEPSPVIVQFVILVQIYGGFSVRNAKKIDCFLAINSQSTNSQFSINYSSFTPLERAYFFLITTCLFQLA